jgi:hypothetical protein
MKYTKQNLEMARENKRTREKDKKFTLKLPKS